MSETNDGVWLQVGADGGGTWFVRADDERLLIDAMRRWAAPDGPDEVLTVTLTGGDDLTILASQLVHVLRSTPEGRRSEVERGASIQREQATLYKEFGFNAGDSTSDPSEPWQGGD